MKYRERECELLRVRELHRDQDSPEEDAILDQMDVLWYELSDEEKAALSAEGPQATPRQSK